MISNSSLSWTISKYFNSPYRPRDLYKDKLCLGPINHLTDSMCPLGSVVSECFNRGNNTTNLPVIPTFGVDHAAIRKRHQEFTSFILYIYQAINDPLDGTLHRRLLVDFWRGHGRPLKLMPQDNDGFFMKYEFTARGPPAPSTIVVLHLGRS